MGLAGDDIKQSIDVAWMRPLTGIRAGRQKQGPTGMGHRFIAQALQMYVMFAHQARAAT